MAASASPDWTSLVQDSERLRAEDNFGIPQPQRTLAQIQEHARQLRQHAGGVSTLSDRRLASHLLGSALDTSALTKKTVDFSVEPLQDELFAEDTWTVEEYMQNMARKNIATAVQARIDEEERQFESFMMQCMDSDWAIERTRLLDSVMATGWERTGQASLPSPAASPAAASPYARLNGLFANSNAGLPQSAQRATEGSGAVSATAHALAAAIGRLVDARNLGSVASFDFIKEFGAALSESDNPSEPVHNRMTTVWEIVTAQLDCLKSAQPPDARAKRKALLGGTLMYLESCYFDFVRKFVEENRYVAQPGGSGAKGALMRAFLTSSSTRNGFGGMLPTDAGFGWHEVYQCLRAGLLDEALAATSQPTIGSPGLHHLSSQLHGWLQEWRRGRRCLPEERAREVSAQCVAALRQPEVAGNTPLAKVVALVLCTLCGSQRAMTAALEVVPRLKETCFTSIEDFLWFRCHAAHADLSARESGPDEHSSLHQLVQDIHLSPPAHYTRNGSRPLQYVAILLMTLQYGRAVTFLHADAMAGKLRDAAAALAVVLTGVGMLDPVGGDSEPGCLHPTKVLSEYARASYGPLNGSLGQIKSPKEYLVVLRAAADMAVMAGGEQNRRLRESALLEGLVTWLSDTQQFALLDQELLERYVPSRPGDGMQRRVLTDAARRFALSDPDGALELFLLGGNFGQALEQVDARLGKKLKALASASASEQDSLGRDIEALALRGRDVHDRCSSYLNLAGGSSLSLEDRSELERAMREHWQGFRDLLVVRDILAHGQLAAAADVDAVVCGARQLSHWLPLLPAQVAVFASKAQDLPPYLRDLMPSVVLLAARALAALANSPGQAPAITQAAMRELEQVKHFAVALRRGAPGITLSVQVMQELNNLR